MFQTPIGGVSMIVSLLIVGIGLTVNFVRGKSKFVRKAFMVVEDLLSGEKFDHFLRRSFAYVIPVAISMLAMVLMINSAFVLKADSNKITLYQLIRPVLVTAKSPLAVPQKDVQAVFLGSSTNPMLSNAPAEASTYSETTNSIADSESDYFFSFQRGKGLNEFMYANGLDPTRENKKILAEYFHIENYDGTKEQNIKLKERLLDLRSSDLSKDEQ